MYKFDLIIVLNSNYLIVKTVQDRKSIHNQERSQSQEFNTKDENSRDSVSISGADEVHEDKKNIELEYEEPETETSNNVSKLNTAPAPKVAASLLWKIIPVIVLIAVAIFLKLRHTEKQIIKLGHTEETQICSFENFKTEYTKVNDLEWKKLQGSIEILLTKMIDEPVVNLLLHHGTPNSYALIKKIAHHTSKCFGTKLKHIKSVDFTGAALENYGHVIAKFRKEVKEGDVVLISNLNEISHEAVRALHFICDTYSPIYKNVVIFLSLTIDENKKGKAYFLADEALRELWESKLKDYEIDPLITRVAEEVILLDS